MAEGPNHELFVQVLAQIERHPESHDQGDWVNDCGTVMCFAGHAAVTVGGLRLINESQQVEFDGRVMHVSDAGAQLLGITWDDAEHPAYQRDCWPSWAGRLFYDADNLDDLYRISADILGVDIDVLMDKVAAEVSA